MENANANKYVVSIIGSKGGSAKSLTGHILSHGLAKLGIDALLAVSDPGRNVRDDINRGYKTYSAQSEQALEVLVNHFVGMSVTKTSIVVLDGGASRKADDVKFAETSSLILVPFLKDMEDIEVAIADVESLRANLSESDFKMVRLLPSRFPTNPFAIKSSWDLINSTFSDEYKKIMLKPVVEMSASAKLNRPDAEKLPSDVHNLARALAAQVLVELGDNPRNYVQPRKF